MKIRFNKSVTVAASKHEKELRFKDGSVYDLSDASAWRWVRRDVAVYYVEEVPKLKVGRPMMGDTEKFSIALKDIDFTETTKSEKPKKVGRPKKGA